MIESGRHRASSRTGALDRSAAIRHRNPNRRKCPRPKAFQSELRSSSGDPRRNCEMVPSVEEDYSGPVLFPMRCRTTCLYDLIAPNVLGKGLAPGRLLRADNRGRLPEVSRARPARLPFGCGRSKRWRSSEGQSPEWGAITWTMRGAGGSCNRGEQRELVNFLPSGGGSRFAISLTSNGHGRAAGQRKHGSCPGKPVHPPPRGELRG